MPGGTRINGIDPARRLRRRSGPGAGTPRPEPQARRALARDERRASGSPRLGRSTGHDDRGRPARDDWHDRAGPEDAPARVEFGLGKYAQIVDGDNDRRQACADRGVIAGPVEHVDPGPRQPERHKAQRPDRARRKSRTSDRKPLSGSASSGAGGSWTRGGCRPASPVPFGHTACRAATNSYVYLAFPVWVYPSGLTSTPTVIAAVPTSTCPPTAARPAHSAAGSRRRPSVLLGTEGWERGHGTISVGGELAGRSGRCKLVRTPPRAGSARTTGCDTTADFVQSEKIGRAWRSASTALIRSLHRVVSAAMPPKNDTTAPPLETIADAFSLTARRYDEFADDHPHLTRMREKVYFAL